MKFPELAFVETAADALKNSGKTFDEKCFSSIGISVRLNLFADHPALAGDNILKEKILNSLSEFNPTINIKVRKLLIDTSTHGFQVLTQQYMD